MKLAEVVITVSILLTALVSHGQVKKKKSHFPIGIFHQEDVDINGLSVGLWSYNGQPRYTNTNGIKLELIGVGLFLPLMPRSPIAENDTSFSLLKKQPISERINGIVLSGSGTVCHCVTNGLTAGFIGQINFQVNGISTSLFMNAAQKHQGIMLSLFNDTFSMKGLQIGISNSAFKNKGIQVAAIGNSAEEMKGLQIGLVNYSAKLKGFQIGLWNINQKRKLPLINWNFSRNTRGK